MCIASLARECHGSFLSQVPWFPVPETWARWGCRTVEKCLFITLSYPHLILMEGFRCSLAVHCPNYKCPQSSDSCQAPVSNRIFFSSGIYLSFFITYYQSNPVYDISEEFLTKTFEMPYKTRCGEGPWEVIMNEVNNFVLPFLFFSCYIQLVISMEGFLKNNMWILVSEN